jgi:hypothetical protein
MQILPLIRFDVTLGFTWGTNQTFELNPERVFQAKVSLSETLA